nr:MAG TPA: hypothetical protein [Caudoviricetes sp.]
MNEDSKKFDLKEVADALSEIMEKVKITAFPKFSALDNDRLLVVYSVSNRAYRNSELPELLPKEALSATLRAGKMNIREIDVYLAEKSVAVFREDDLREMIENVMERDEQHKSWDEHMMYLIHDSPETKAFLQYLNGCAKELTTYTEGEQVEMDWRG